MRLVHAGFECGEEASPTRQSLQEQFRRTPYRPRSPSTVLCGVHGAAEMTWLCWCIGASMIGVGVVVVARGRPALGAYYIALGLLMGPGMGSVVY